MSGIVLSSSVRQNLLSLQSTADLLSSTQSRLSTGKKVNSALDNPTNFFTAQSLDNRASDISNLLDGVSNGVQVLQAANTGITSLQKLVDSAKSVAQQVLQAPVGYSAKSSTTTAAAIGGTAANLNDGVSFNTGTTLSVTPAGGGTAAVFTFTATTTLADLNAGIASAGVTATLDSSNKLVITNTNNDTASSTLAAVTLGGTPGSTPATFGTPTAPVKDAGSQAARDNLVTQYNTIVDNITKTAQDSSYNGINLLNGDNLKLTFNETGTSKLAITGTTSDANGLGLKTLGATDFRDSTSANAVITSLSKASSSLRTQASTLGSNLSVVEIRKDFSKNLINVLQTGSSNLTLADTNEEAANSQALSTRQSIAVSALSLANQSQQSVLQLLR